MGATLINISVDSSLMLGLVIDGVQWSLYIFVKKSIDTQIADIVAELSATRKRIERTK